MKDFYISHARSDDQWAEWLAFHLEEAGFSTILEAWDFRAGRNFVLEMQAALRASHRVVAVLSPDYLIGEYSRAQWAAAFAQDPTGERGGLLPVCVKRCQPDGLLGQIVTIDLVGLDEAAARARLLGAVGKGPADRRGARPAFPGLRRAAERPSFPGDVSSLLQRLPLPLAQLLRRALNGKSAMERHHNAYYVAEATLKLAAGLRIGLWLDRALDPAAAVARRLESLMLPTLADWLALLGDVDRALAARPDVALLPLGGRLGRLAEPDERGAARALARAGLEAGLAPAVCASAERGETLGFFALVAAYHDQVIAGGGARPAVFYDRFATLLLDATRELLAAPELFGGLRLHHARLQLTDGGRDVGWSWQDLTGPASVPAPDAPSLPAGITPGHLYFVGEGAAVPLHPMAIYREDDLGQEAVGLLNRTHRRTRRVGDGGVEEVLRADFLDYATGQNLEGVDAGEALTGLLGRLRGRPATSEDLRGVVEQSRAALAGRVEEVVAAGAAIGDFEILGEIGRGGMGIVYRARQRSLERTVALKVLPPSRASDPVTRERFRREIAALARCDHPNVVKILASGTDGERAYYAMEYVDGADLGRVARLLSRWQSSGGGGLREGHIAAAISSSGGTRVAREDRPAQSPPPDDLPPVPRIDQGRPLHLRLAELFADAAVGLAHLHQHKVLHRDVKPSNLMLTADGRRIVIMDLGLVRLDDASRDLTDSRVEVLGTLRYMSPERLDGRPVDVRADVYGLGASLYELLTGRPLHDGDTEVRLRRQILEEDPLPPRRIDAAIPRDLAAIVTVATAREPERRYSSALALASDLHAFSELRPIAASPPGRLRALALKARRRPGLTGATAGLVLLALGGGGAFWNWNRVRVEYVDGTVERWGVVEGVAILDEAQRRGAERTLRLSHRRGRLVKSERVNAAGRLRNGTEDCAVWDYTYTEDGGIRDRVCSNRFGEVMLRMSYSLGLKRLDRLDAHVQPKPEKDTDITTRLCEYDDRGFLREERFTNPQRTPRPDAEGAFGYLYSRDDRGLAVRIEPLAADWSPTPTRRGVAATTRAWSALGDMTEEAYFDKDARPINGKDGYASMRQTFDTAGNLLAADYFGTDGKPTVGADGYAGERTVRDGSGNVIERTLVDTSGKPTVLLHGKPAGYARMRAEYDTRGNPVAWSYFDAAGKLTMNQGEDGRFARVRFKYDDADNQIEATYFDLVEGQIIRNEHGVAIVRHEYDLQGHHLKEVYLDEDGKPTHCKHGVAGWTYSHDGYGRLLKKLSLGTNGLPSICKEDGTAGTELTYDEHGNMAERKWIGVDGSAMRAKRGAAIERYKYDKFGKCVEVEYLDTNGNPTLDADGSAFWRSHYDERGNLVETSNFNVRNELALLKLGWAVQRFHYDPHGNKDSIDYLGTGPNPGPIRDRQGVAGYRFEFDDRNRETTRWHVGTDGKPTLHEDGCAGYRTAWDEHGKQTEVSCFGVDGQPTLLKNGTAGWRAKYDGQLREIERTYVDAAGDPTLIDEGYASYRTTYDERGNPIEIAYFDRDDKRTLDHEGKAIYRTSYDARGYEVEYAYFGVDNNPIVFKNGYASGRYETDDRGNYNRMRYFDSDGRPTLSREGMFEITMEHDARDRIIKETYQGVDGRPILNDGGYANFKAHYDERDQRDEFGFFGLDGNPILSKGGNAAARVRYDDWGNEIEWTSLGIDHKPIVTKEGYAIIQWERDGRGRTIEGRMLGASGELLSTANGYARWTATYDERGHLREQKYFDARGKATLDKTGVAVVRHAYDEHGNETEIAFFGTDGKTAVRSKDGYAVERMLYDDRRRVVLRSYFDVDDRPVMRKGGYASHGTHWDARGNRDEEEYRGVGVDGGRVTSAEGYALVKRRFDPHGRELEEAYFGVDGEQRVIGKSGYAIRRRRYDERGNVVEEEYLGTRKERVSMKDGAAGYLAAFAPPDKEVRRVAFDARGEAVSGRGDGFLWKLAGGKPVVTGTDGKPLADRSLASRHEARARAAVKGYEAERLRAAKPELFRGARGVLVVEVAQGSHAARAGIAPGCVLLVHGNRTIDQPYDLTAAGTTTARLELLCDGHAASVEARLDELGAVVEPM